METGKVSFSQISPNIIPAKYLKYFFAKISSWEKRKKTLENCLAKINSLLHEFTS